MECPMCKETIQDGAIKCKHCGSDLQVNNQVAHPSDEVPNGFSCYTYALKNYAKFSGRARRREYWFFVLFTVLVSIGLSIVDGIIGTFDSQSGYGLLSGLYSLAVFIPSLAVSVRRLHDIGRSGWWLLIGLIPLIGAIVLLIFFVMDSKKQGSEYGAPRKQLNLA